MSHCKMTATTLLFLGLSALICASSLQAETERNCFIEGYISADRNLESPELGEWKYTLSVSWDTGGKSSMSHFNLSFGESPECSCNELQAGLHWQERLGWSNGLQEGESTGYTCRMECYGDPSLGLKGPMMKMEPYERARWGPGVIGRGEFVFYSDYGPWRIQRENQYMSMKFAKESCQGPLKGMFPGLPCDPTPSEVQTWGSIKQYYR